MYTSFHIENFRCFEKLDLNDIARVNLIAGKNSVGKTSLLEALLIHSGRYDAVLYRSYPSTIGQLDYQHSRRFSYYSFPTSTLTERIGWYMLFQAFNTAEPILLRGTLFTAQPRQPALLKTRGENQLKITIGDIEQLSDDPKFVSYLVGTRDNGELSLPNMEVLQFEDDSGHKSHIIHHKSEITIDTLPAPYPIIFLSARNRVSPSDDATRFSNLKRIRETDILIESLRIIEPRLQDLDLLSNGIHADIDGMEQLVPLSVMGDGVGRITSLVLAISDARDGIVVIDEVENGLHYSVQVDVWRVLADAARRFNTQIFATTHSFEMIRAAHQAFSQDVGYDFRLHRLDRSGENGTIRAVTYDRETIEAALELNLEVR
jgi:predicted ATPase